MLYISTMQFPYSKLKLWTWDNSDSTN